MEPETLTKAEAAIYHKVSTKTIDRWIASGHLKAIRLGPRIVRVDKNSLERLGKPIIATDKLETIPAIDLENYCREQRKRADYEAWHLYNLLEQYVQVVAEYNRWVKQELDQNYTELHLEMRAMQTEFLKRTNNGGNNG